MHKKLRRAIHVLRDATEAEELLFDIYIAMCESPETRMGGELWLKMEEYIWTRIPEQLKDPKTIFDKIEAQDGARKGGGFSEGPTADNTPIKEWKTWD